MYETHNTVMNGQYVTLHRCRECNKHLWYATGVPSDNNGFVPIDQPIRHLPSCILYRRGDERQPRKRQGAIS